MEEDPAWNFKFFSFIVKYVSLILVEKEIHIHVMQWALLKDSAEGHLAIIMVVDHVGRG